ncbi:hypothetical protein RvY_00101 [Ramazzottius varieornatus]|uniref:Uncharacterized protein n=1 Tax=Ramazzottius varieornatus TaxID=947166 RepID=A0A1D1UM52_RAMVA|nr:hypothetical protein RvY_00101 [Ramazzottius varieornatus]
MDPVNPFSILKLLQSDYEQYFQLSDPPSEFNRMLKTFIKDVQIDLAGNTIPPKGTGHIQPLDVLRFDRRVAQLRMLLVVRLQ